MTTPTELPDHTPRREVLMHTVSPRRRATAVVLLLALVATMFAAAPSASAAYTDEQAWACSADNQIYPVGSSTVLSDYSILYAGNCGIHSLARLGQPDAVAYYGQFGFDKNFMLWAPEERVDVGERYFGGCRVAHATGTFCPGGTGNVAYNYQVKADWLGLSTVKRWGNAFISLRCGNHSRPSDGIPAGPIPTIAGTKFEDRNGNGTRDAGEPGLAGVTIHLAYNGNRVWSTTTGSDGRYSFRIDTVAHPSWGVGSYAVSEDVPAGYRQTRAPGAVQLDHGVADRTFDGLDFGNQKETDVAITKSTQTATTIAGLDTTWQLDVVNNGPWPAPDVVVTDTVDPASFSSVGAVPAPCTLTGHAIRCELGTLPVGATRRLVFTARSRPQLAKDLTVPNTASVTTSMRDPVTGNNSSTAVTVIDTRADLAITKTASKTYVDGGEALDWTITITNNGPSTARTVRVSDPVPYDVAIDSVTPASCQVVEQQVTCTLGDLDPGATRTIVVRSHMRGAPIPPDDPSHGDHLLGFDKVDVTWSLDAGQRGVVDLGSCPQAGIVTDVSAWVTSVDQGTGSPSDVEVVSATTPTPTRGRLELRNHATGRAQGHGSLTCLRPRTVSGDDHGHAVTYGPAVTRSVDLPTGRHTVVLPVGLDQYAVAPTYSVTDGRARLVTSSATDDGWALTFETAGPSARVDVAVRPIDRRLAAGGSPSHSHDTVLAHPVITVALPTGRSTATVTCPEGFKGITATWDVPAGVAVGNEPQPVSRVFTFDNETGGPASATADLLCLRERTGRIGDPPPVTVTNTATVTSTTVDPVPSSNSSAATVVVRRALGSAQPPAPAPTPTIGTFAARGNEVRGRLVCRTSCVATVSLRSGKRVWQVRQVRLKSKQGQVLTFRDPRGRQRLTVVVKIGKRTWSTRVRG